MKNKLLFTLQDKAKNAEGYEKREWIRLREIIVELKVRAKHNRYCAVYTEDNLRCSCGLSKLKEEIC